MTAASFSPGCFAEKCGEFDGYGLRSDKLELLVLPELGAKVVRLRSLVSGRDWMWHPAGDLRLFRSAAGARFETGTLAGADECLPTISPCRFDGRSFADHGEAWTAAWKLDRAAFEGGELRTTVDLAATLRCERRITVAGNEISFRYRIENLSAGLQPFLWAFHPLFAWEPEDRIELPEAVRRVRVTATSGCGEAGERDWELVWRAAGRDHMPAGYVKAFADLGGCETAFAAVRRGAERLAIHFDGNEIRYLGIWLTREGWNGHTHLALEPTTAPTDSLAVAATREDAWLVAREERAWRFRIRLGE